MVHKSLRLWSGRVMTRGAVLNPGPAPWPGLTLPGQMVESQEASGLSPRGTGAPNSDSQNLADTWS